MPHAFALFSFIITTDVPRRHFTKIKPPSPLAKVGFELEPGEENGIGMGHGRSVVQPERVLKIF